MTLCSSRTNHSRIQIPSPSLQVPTLILVRRRHRPTIAVELQKNQQSKLQDFTLEKGYRGLNGLGTFHKRAKMFLSRVSFRYFGVLFMSRSGYVYLPLIVQIEQFCVL